MTLSKDAIERGVALFQTLIDEEPELRREFEASAAEFFGGVTPAAYGSGEGERLARRRHLEWFALERSSEHLGGVPAEALMEAWIARSEPQDNAEAFLNAQAGVFEVTGVEAGRGVWMRDLLGLGEYPLDEPEAAVEFARGDLVVGRVFPVGDTLYRLSPVAARFRNTELITALKSNMAELRSSRRGSMRMAQPEIERMFHAPGARFAGAGAPIDHAARAARAREVLLGAGVPAPLAERVLAELARAAGNGDEAALTEALNQLAFETDADLELARRELGELWSTLRAAGPAPTGSHTPDGDTVSTATAANALERFDEARRGGGDLAGLFGTLEEDLGIESADDGDGDEEVPEFPGVVGAMVEEFLWETGREVGDEGAARYDGLRRLGRFAESVGIFENLGRRDLLDFAARWLLDEGALGSAVEADAVLQALAAFCHWCEDRQDLPLWKDFGATLERLQASVPRLVEARKRIAGSRDDDAKLYEFGRDERGKCVLIDANDTRESVELEQGLAARLRAGDLVLARRAAADDVRVCACYPGELAALRPTV